jgi:hypothetical protein
MKVWKWIARNNKGETETLTTRGPETAEQVMYMANGSLLATRNQRYKDANGEDPGWHTKLADIRLAGESDAPFGQWKPPGARKVDIGPKPPTPELADDDDAL